MPASNKEHIRGKIFPKGQVVIPALLRKKYNIQIGDPIIFSVSDEGILLKPAKQSKTGLAEKLFGIYAAQRAAREGVTQADITKAAEDGFAGKWEK